MGIFKPKVGDQVDQVDQVDQPTLNENISALREMNAAMERDMVRLVTQKETETALSVRPAYDEYPLRRHMLRVEHALREILTGDPDYEGIDFIFGQVPGNIDAHFCVTPRISGEGTQRRATLEKWRAEIVPAFMQGVPDHMTCQQMGIYLNVEVDEELLLTDITDVAVREKYGDSDRMKGARVVIDSSSPNIAKTMHVGHLRSTVIGQVLANLLQANGAIVYSINHLGDWGTQFGQLVSAHERWAEDVERSHPSASNPVGFLGELYRRIKQAIAEEKDEGGETPLADEGRRNFAALEKGDPRVTRLWREFRELSLLEFAKVYARLGITFDEFLGEAYYEDKMEEVIDRAIHAGFAHVSEDGALVVDLSKYGLRTFLLRKSDGASNYATRDLAALKHRPSLFHADTVLYVVGSEQKDHFRQCFTLSQQLGDIQEGVAEHVHFGMITKDGKKVASREGAGSLDSLLDELKRVSLAELQGKYPDSPGETLESSAEAIGRGALIYRNFMQNRERDMDYNPEDMLSMNAQSGPYLQYTCLRIQKLLGNMTDDTGDTGDITAEDDGFSKLLNPGMKKEVLELGRFPDVIASAAKDRAPHILARYLYDLCLAFNTLYGDKEVRFKDLPPKQKAANRKAMQGILNVITRGLALLNIELPAIM